MYLADFTSSGLSALNWTNFTENIPERNYSTSIREIKMNIICILERESLYKNSKKLKIKHYYEEFERGHSGNSYRFDPSLPMLYAAIS